MKKINDGFNLNAGKRIMKKKKCIIFGLTIFTQMLRHLEEEFYDVEIVAYTVDRKYKQEDVFDGLPVVAFEDLAQNYPNSEYSVLIGLGYSHMNNIRKQKFEEVKSKGYKIESFVHPQVIRDNTFEMGEGNIILEGAILGYKVKIGNGNIIWNGCNISHESIIEDFSYFSPGSTLGGKTIVKNNCFLGMNSVVRGSRVISEYTLIGAGCYVNNGTKPYGVYVPARSVCLENKKSTDMM